MTDKFSNREGATVGQAFTVHCPTCGRSALYSDRNPVRPFCSSQCQTGDLAAWASDEYKIASQEKPGSDQEENQNFDENY